MTNTYDRKFVGIKYEWDDLSIDEKKEYDEAVITDDNDLLNIFSSGLFFVGSEKPEKPSVGDVIYKDDNLYIYCNNEWIDIGTYEEKSESAVKMVAPHICTQCAAPIPKGSNKCIFCDTEFY